MTYHSSNLGDNIGSHNGIDTIIRLGGEIGYQPCFVEGWKA